MEVTLRLDEEKADGIEWVLGESREPNPKACPLTFSSFFFFLAEFVHGPRPRSLLPEEDDHGRSLVTKLTHAHGEFSMTLDNPASKLAYHGKSRDKKRLKDKANKDNDDDDDEDDDDDGDDEKNGKKKKTKKNGKKRHDGNEDEDDDEEQGAKFMLAVVDRKKKKIAEILPYDSGLMMTLHHTVKGFVPTQPEDHSEVNRGTYVREFASHREQKRLKDAVDAAITADSIKITGQMDSARASHKAELDALKREKTPMLPAHDSETTDASQIYNVRSLCDAELQAAIVSLMKERFGEALEKEEKHVLQAATESVDPSLRDFFTEGILAVHKHDKDPEAKENMVLALGFVLVVTCFLQDEHPKRGESNHKSTLFSDLQKPFGKVKNALNHSFAAKGADARRFDMDAAARVRVINYGVVAMVLLSPKLQVDLSHVCSVFGLVSATAKLHVQSIGCKAPARTTVYELKAPLVLPTMAARPMQKKKK